jgi:hypothetical protein
MLLMDKRKRFRVPEPPSHAGDFAWALFDALKWAGGYRALQRFLFEQGEKISVTHMNNLREGMFVRYFFVMRASSSLASVEATSLMGMPRASAICWNVSCMDGDGLPGRATTPMAAYMRAARSGRP